MKDLKLLLAYQCPQMKLTHIEGEHAFTASTNNNATIEDYESEDLFD